MRDTLAKDEGLYSILLQKNDWCFIVERIVTIGGELVILQF